MDARNAPTKPSVEVRLLGRFSIRGSELLAPDALPGAAEHLLGYLFVQPNRRADRESIARDLWGAGLSDPAGEISGAMRAVRDLLSPSAGGALLVESEDGTIAVAPEAALRVDYDEFHRVAREALDGASGPPEEVVKLALTGDRLYEGHLLEGWSGAWIQGPREATLRSYLELLDALLRHFDAAGDHARVVLYATRTLAAAPLHENAHWHLISSLHRLGDDAGALRHYERMAAALSHDAGREQDPRRRAIAEAVRTGASGLGGRNREPAV